MSRRSDRESRNHRNARDNSYPLIDDITGFRISSKDAVVDWNGSVTHRKNVRGMPSSLILPELPENELLQPGPVRKEKFTWRSPELYDFEEDIAYNDVSYKTVQGLNAVALNPEYTLLQSQNPVYWGDTDAVWNVTLGQWVNRTYNENAQFGVTSFIATFGEDIVPTFVQLPPN